MTIGERIAFQFMSAVFFFFSAVDLSSCSEDEYDSDDSDRDLR